MNEYVLSNQARREFKQLILDQSKKRKVFLVLSPYHSKLYARMKNELPIFLKIENEYMQLAKESRTTIIGSYDTYVVGYKIDEFYDGMHPKEGYMSKVVASAQSVFQNGCIEFLKSSVKVNCFPN